MAKQAKQKAKKKLKVRPIGEKVLIKRLEAEIMTKGGIVLPDAAPCPPPFPGYRDTQRHGHGSTLARIR